MRYRPSDPAAQEAHRDKLALLTLDLADLPPDLLEVEIAAWVTAKPFMPKASELAEGVRARVEAMRPRGTLDEQCVARNAMLDEAGNERMRWRITSDGQWQAVDYDEWRRDEGLPRLARKGPPLPPPLTAEQFDRVVAERGVALSACLDRGAIIPNGRGGFRQPDPEG